MACFPQVQMTLWDDIGGDESGARRDATGNEPEEVRC